VLSTAALLAKFDPSAWYAWIAYAAAIYLFWSGVFEKGHKQFGWLRRKIHPPIAPPVPLTQEPDVVLGHPGGQQSTTPLHEIPAGEHGRLIRVEPRYLIENKDPTVGIRDVTTGVQTRDGRTHVFDSFFAALIAASSDALVENVGSIPMDFLDDVHESAAFTTFLYWTRFTRQGVRWEVVYDPESRRNTYAQIPMPQPELRARVYERAARSYSIEITNSGNVRIDEVECVLPDEATNWQLLTDALAAYPIKTLDPGESQAIPVVVTLGPAVSVELTLRGRAEAVPYERTQVVSILG